MPDYVDTTTLQLYRSQWPQPAGTEELSRAEYNAAQAIPGRYRQWTGSAVVEMTQGEKDAVDAAALEQERDSTAAQLDLVEDVVRALALAMLDEFNVVRNRAYGGLYRDAAVTSQSIANNTFTKLTALTGASAQATGGGTVSDTTNGEIVLPAAGDYLVSWSLSFSGDLNTSFAVAAFGNNVRASGTTAVRELGSGSGVGSMGAVGIVNAPVADVAIDLRAGQGEGTARDLTVEAFQLTVQDVTDRPPRTIAQLKSVLRNKLGM